MSITNLVLQGFSNGTVSSSISKMALFGFDTTEAPSTQWIDKAAASTSWGDKLASESGWVDIAASSSTWVDK